MKKRICFAPGPTMVREDIQREIEKARGIHHRDQLFPKLLAEINERMKDLFDAPDGTVLFFRGGGREVMAKVAWAFTSPAYETLILNTGRFGDSWESIVESVQGRAARSIKEQWGWSYRLPLAESFLKHFPVGLILMTSGETSTGVRNPEGPIAEARNSLVPNALLVTDAVLEAGASPLKMNAQGIDVLVGASQKVFCLPPGMGFIVLSRRAVEHLRRPEPGAPHDPFPLFDEVEAAKTGRVTQTPPIDHLVGLRAVLRDIELTGEDRWYEWHRARAVGFRNTLLHLDRRFKLFTKENPTNAISVFSLPEGKSAYALKEALEDRYNFVVETGMGNYSNSVIRVAHFYSTAEWEGHLIRAIDEIMESI